MNDRAPAAPPGPTTELDKLRRRVEALSRKRDEAESRLHALLDSLLPLDDLLVDTCRRTGALFTARSARETTSAAVALSEQIDAAHQMLRNEFARYDVRPMSVVGRAVDPAEMRVVGTQAHPSAPNGTVLRERAAGFFLGGSVLRAAEVIVAVPGTAPEPEPTPAAGGSLNAEASERPPAARGRAQPRRTTRSQRLPRKRSAKGKRRARRT